MAISLFCSSIYLSGYNLITLLSPRIFLHCRKCKLVVYSRFKEVSKVSHFHFKMSDLSCPHEKCINPYKMCPLIIIHIIIHISCFCRTAVANGLKLKSYIYLYLLNLVVGTKFTVNTCHHVYMLSPDKLSLPLIRSSKPNLTRAPVFIHTTITEARLEHCLPFSCLGYL